MKKIKHFATVSALMLLPFVVGAQTGGNNPPAGNTTFDSNNTFQQFLQSILDFINNTLIPFILGIAFLLFVWGMFQYFIAGGANEEAKEKGKSLLIYAILGFVIIIVFWGVINLLGSATGLQNQAFQFNVAGNPQTQP